MKSNCCNIILASIVFAILSFIESQPAATQELIITDLGQRGQIESEAAISAGMPKYVPDQVIFKLLIPIDRRGRELIEIQQLLQQVARSHGLERIVPAFRKTLKAPLEHIYRAHLPPGVSPIEAREQLEANPAIEWAEPNYYRYTQEITPNDPSFGLQWHLQAIDTASAWDVTTGNSDVVIAIIDTGVDWGHPDLAANIWINAGEIEGDNIDNDGNGFVDDVRGWDFVSVDQSEVYTGEDPGPPDNDPMDFHGHGTHVSGIAGAVGNNGIGITGVNWNVSLMALRAGYKNKSGSGVLQISDIADALVYAADNGADIVNMSFGGYDISHTERVAIDYCASVGVLLVASAGNDRSDTPSYPAGFDNVLAVASVNWYNCRSRFSNYGVWIDVAAPGESIYSTLVGGDYGRKSGTSMASPVVAGVAGLVKSAHPTWTAGQIALQLRATTNNINADNPDFVNLLGAGLVVANQAVRVTTPPVRLGVVSLCAEETNGSSDGWFDPGEMIELRPSVRNFALEQIGISISLTTDDPYVSILDDVSLIGHLDENCTATTWDDPLSISIETDVPQDHIARLTLDISTGESGVVATDAISLRLNPILGDPALLVYHTSEIGYRDPQVLAKPGGGLTVLYRSDGFVENQVYSRTADSSGNWMPAVYISEVPGVLSAREHHGAVAEDDRIHVIFMGVLGSWDAELFYTTQDPTAGTWSTPIQLTTNAEIYDPSFVAPSTIAVDPLGHPHVVWADYRSGDAEFFHFYHNGSNWSGEVMIVRPSADPGSLHLLFDSAGIGYLLWGQWADGSIYMMKLIGSTWSSPVLVTTTSGSTYLSVTVDSQDRLHMVYEAPNGDDVSYRNYNGTTWSSAEVIMWDTYVYGVRTLIATAPGDLLHVVREANPYFSIGGVSQIYEVIYEDTSWSSMMPITFDDAGTNLYDLDLMLDGLGTRFLAGMLHTEDIVFLSSDRDPARLPSRPRVLDDGPTTSDPTSLHASWSLVNPSDIAEYEYAIGTTPREADLRYWISVGTATDVTADLIDTPLIPYQSYYVNVRARNNSGYLSPIGSSDGIVILPVPNLISAQSDDGQVTLTWSDEHSNDPGVLGYRIYYDQAGETQLVTEVEQTTTYTDTGLTNGQEYCYKVTSLYADCESGFSNILCAIPNNQGEATVVINELNTLRYERTGKGKNKTIDSIDTDTFNAGDEVVIRAYVVDGNNKAVANAEVSIEVTGPETHSFIGISDNIGVAEVIWNTFAPRKKRSGTEPGNYTATVTNAMAEGYTWDGVSTSTPITIK